MVEVIKARVNQLKTELITQLNVVFTAVLLWVSQQNDAPFVGDLVALLPEGLQGIGKVVLPMLVGIVVQFAVELLRKRTAEQAVAEAEANVAGA